MGFILKHYILHLFTVNDIAKPSVNVIFILIAVSLLVAIGFLVSFIWSIKSGQYDDEYTPSVRILFDDETNVIEDQKEKADKTNPGTNSKIQIPNSKQIQNTNSKSQPNDQ